MNVWLIVIPVVLLALSIRFWIIPEWAASKGGWKRAEEILGTEPKDGKRVGGLFKSARLRLPAYFMLFETYGVMEVRVCPTGLQMGPPAMMLFRKPVRVPWDRLRVDLGGGKGVFGLKFGKNAVLQADGVPDFSVELSQDLLKRIGEEAGPVWSGFARLRQDMENQA
jgi:hypothetical protein